MGAILLCQCAAITAVSALQYHRFALGQDFGAYSQAWWNIGHFHMNPWCPFFATAFVRNNAELLMWPLALLYHIWSSPFFLLVVQAVAFVLTEYVVVRWTTEMLEKARFGSEHLRAFVTAGVVVALIANPWFYSAISFDFHFQAFAALFAALAGWSAWSGRWRRLWLWIPLTMVSCLAGALCVVGIGLGAVLAGRATRRLGAVVLLVGLAWVEILSVLKTVGQGGRLLQLQYGYLAGTQARPTSSIAVLVSAFQHPGAAWHVASGRLAYLTVFLASAGFFGIVSPWGLSVTVAVVTPTLLSASPLFTTTAFQNWPVIVFVLVGTVQVVIWVLERPRTDWWHRGKVLLVGSSIVSLSATAFWALPFALRSWVTVSPQTAQVLAQLNRSIPQRAEVIASIGEVGRFAIRKEVYSFPYQFSPTGDEGTYPVRSPTVYFLFVDDSDRGNPPTHYTDSAIRYVRRSLSAQVLVARGGVFAFRWRPRPGMTQVVLHLNPR